MTRGVVMMSRDNVAVTRTIKTVPRGMVDDQTQSGSEEVTEDSDQGSSDSDQGLYDSDNMTSHNRHKGMTGTP